MDSSNPNRTNLPNIGQIILICFLILIVILVRLLSPEDDWICQNGEWVKHGYPLTEKPTTSCSGQPQLISKQNFQTVNLYFHKNDELLDCSQTFAVSRELTSGLLETEYYQTIINELFKGPTEEEKKLGFTSFFSSDTTSILKSIKILNNKAYINLTDIRQVIPNVSSSCGSQEFISEIKNTLIDNSQGQINDVLFAINNEPKTFYDWIQVGCDSKTENCNRVPFLDKISK